MGDRANIVMTQSPAVGRPSAANIYIYTHWYGSILPRLLQAALKRGVDRWEDEPYLCRIIIGELTRSDPLGTIGVGVSTYQCDNDGYPLLLVNVEDGIVELDGFGKLSFEQYVALDMPADDRLDPWETFKIGIAAAERVAKASEMAAAKVMSALNVAMDEAVAPATIACVACGQQTPIDSAYLGMDTVCDPCMEPQPGAPTATVHSLGTPGAAESRHWRQTPPEVLHDPNAQQTVDRNWSLDRPSNPLPYPPTADTTQRWPFPVPKKD